ncbi:hypothetical protein KDW_58270 [Dictyobacter vulcani]|uniref:Uncharacterized protein n=1 Tax=Dictyobacter vulcani TaxID=2607529 RepID=A0A5J4KUR6_9CHLR|nr:hypothetical protein KDW_58270 [Dictyobacter vulcani]
MQIRATSGNFMTQLSPLNEMSMSSDVLNTSIDDIHTVIHILSLGQILCQQIKGLCLDSVRRCAM